MFLIEVGHVLRAIGIALLALLLLVGGKVMLDLASKEVQGRLAQLPLLILQVARWRLPRDLRESMHDDWWVPDLQERLQRDDERPITRLLKGLHFAVSLVFKAGRTALAAGVPSAAARMRKAVRGKRRRPDVLSLGVLAVLSLTSVVTVAQQISRSFPTVSWWGAVVLGILASAAVAIPVEVFGRTQARTCSMT